MYLDNALMIDNYNIISFFCSSIYLNWILQRMNRIFFVAVLHCINKTFKIINI